MTASLGYIQPDDIKITLATVMLNLSNDEDVSADEGILHHAEGVDLLPANIELSALEVYLVNAISRESIMKLYVNLVRPNYDYIIIDCIRSYLTSYVKKQMMYMVEGFQFMLDA